MKIVRNIFSIIIVIALAYIGWVQIPRELLIEWDVKLGVARYPIYVLGPIIFLIIVDIILSRLILFLKWLFQEFLGIHYGLTGSKNKEKRIMAGRAIRDLMCFRRGEAARNFYNAGLYSRAGENFEKAGDYASAADSFQNVGNLERAAKMFEKAGKYESAGECYRDSGKRSDSTRCFSLAGEHLADNGKPLLAAEAFVKSGMFRKAGEYFLKGGHAQKAAENFENAGDMLKAAECYLEAAKKRAGTMEKKAAFASSSKTDDGLRSCARKAGDLFFDAGYTEKAQESFILSGDTEKAAEICVHNGEFKTAARILQKAGRWEEAMACYERIGDGKNMKKMRARLEEQNGDMQLAARLYRESGDLNKALEIYRFLHDHSGQAVCLEAMDRPLAAANYYAMAGEKFKAAELYKELGNLREAAELYRDLGMMREAADCASESDNPYYSALFEYEQANYNEAISLLRFLPHSFPDYQKAMLLLGKSYFQIRRYALAIDAYERVINKIPLNDKSIDDFYFYARCLESTGNNPHALEIYYRIINFDENFRDTNKRIREMTSSGRRKRRLTLEELAREQTGEETPVKDEFHDQKTIMEETTTNHDSPTIIEEQKTVIEEEAYAENEETIISDENDIEEVEDKDLDKSETETFITPTAISDKYEILETIHDREDGLIKITKARVKDTEEIVALKIMEDDIWTTPETRGRFQKEIQSLSIIEHPNIARIIDFGQSKNGHYIALEYLEGGSLLERLDVEKALSPRKSLSILQNIAEGLNQAHKRDIIHGNLKPSKIIFTTEGIPKIIDFCLAIIVPNTTLVMEASEKGGLRDLRYMAPEQIKGSPPAAKGDIYSLGLTFFYMLTGKTPFGALSIIDTDEIIDVHLQGGFISPRDINNVIPSMYCELFHDMTSQDPEKRISSAREVVERIIEIRLATNADL